MRTRFRRSVQSIPRKARRGETKIHSVGDFRDFLQQELAQTLDRPLELGDPRFEVGGESVQAPLTSLLRQTTPQGDALLEGTKGLPEGLLDALVLGLEQGLRGEGMAGPAPEAEQVALLDLPEHSPAVRAGHDRLDARLVVASELARVEPGDPG